MSGSAPPNTVARSLGSGKYPTAKKSNTTAHCGLELVVGLPVFDVAHGPQHHVEPCRCLIPTRNTWVSLNVGSVCDLGTVPQFGVLWVSLHTNLKRVPSKSHTHTQVFLIPLTTVDGKKLTVAVVQNTLFLALGKDSHAPLRRELRRPGKGSLCEGSHDHSSHNEL